MKELLQELQQSKLIRVTGSYADGTQNSNSDIDFYIKPDHPDWKFKGKERNITKVIEILKKHKVNWQSDAPGYIYSHKSINALPIQIEFSDFFSPRKNKLKQVEIMGIIFKTY